jgi:hypothetical protein
LSQKEVDSWLITKSGGKTSEVDVTGYWQDTKGTGMFTWGEGYLYQDQNRIKGNIGDYTIIGIVAGKTAYLVLMYGNRVYYTARLELVKELLSGHYFSAKDKEQKSGYPMALVRKGK